MKFEIVELPGEDLPPMDDPGATRSPEMDDSADPLAGLRAGTARLAESVRAEVRHISHCMAEMMELMTPAREASYARHRGEVAPPPANFRADRFGGSPTC
jgi:hypothetical protein